MNSSILGADDMPGRMGFVIDRVGTGAGVMDDERFEELDSPVQSRVDR